MASNGKSITCCAAGDSFITRRLATNDPHADKLAALMANADVRFTNLEVVVRRQEGFPSAQSGGTWATTEPESLEDLRAYGFNLLAWATNHTLDYSYGGLAATGHYLDRGGWVHAGSGPDLPTAQAPGWLETPAGRVALLAVTSSFHESWTAGQPRPDIGGRPGVNPLRSRIRYRVGPETIAWLKRTAAECGLNAEQALKVQEGFAREDPPALTRFGNHLFHPLEPGGVPGAVTTADPRDRDRMIQQIKAVRNKADCVLVSLHAHQMKDGDKECPADFVGEFARACIDAGADAVIGHGPHILRPIEIYRQRPIFYSLGNFIFQSDTVPYLPADYYEAYGCPPDATVTEALAARTAGGTRGLGCDPRVWRSVVACWTMQDGRLTQLRLHPIDLGFQQATDRHGWPHACNDPAALQDMIRLCRPFGVKWEIKEATAHWINEA